MDECLREVLAQRETRFKGILVDVEHWQVILPNGKPALREVVLHRGAAAVVPVDSQGMVTLVRQHRVAVDKVTLEIPAGKLDAPGEDPLACAMRELKEETGMNAAQWRLLTNLDTTPGFCTERIAIYLAQGLTEGKAAPDADEFLGLTRLPLAEAVANAMSGELTDGKTIVGLLMAAKALGL